VSAVTEAARADARVRWIGRSKWLLLAAIVVIAVAWPYITSSFYVSMGTQALFYGLFALSINLLGGYGGMVTLGHAGLLGTAGYALAIFTTRSGMGLWPAIVASLGVCALVSAFFGLLAVRTRGTYFVMITLAEGMIVWGIAVRWQALTGGDNGITGVPRPSFAESYWEYYYFVLVVVAVCTFLIGRLVRSPFGLTLRGIREAEDRLPSFGYHVTLHKLIAFTLSGMFAGVAGLLLAMYNNFFGTTQVFFLASAQGLLMSILGGVGTLAGAFVGSSIVVYIQQYVSSYVDRWMTLLGVIFVLVVLLAPDGLVGAWTRVVWGSFVRRMTGRGEVDASPDAAGGTEAGAAIAGGEAGSESSRPVAASVERKARR
jgi:branched-chain amino acid transport system permease protein